MATQIADGLVRWLLAQHRQAIRELLACEAFTAQAVAEVGSVSDLDAIQFHHKITVEANRVLDGKLADGGGWVDGEGAEAGVVEILASPLSGLTSYIASEIELVETILERSSDNLLDASSLSDNVVEQARQTLHTLRLIEAVLDGEIDDF